MYVYNIRKKDNKNNTFAVNHITFIIMYMEQSFDFLAQRLSDNGLRAEQETMEHYPEKTILQTEHAAEFVRAAKLMDVVAQQERHEADLKDTLGLG